jgi:hypothetical protein
MAPHQFIVSLQIATPRLPYQQRFIRWRGHL